MNAIGLLCDIAAQGAKTSAASYRSVASYQRLLDYGFLKEAGIVAAVPCLECGQPHDAEVIHDGQVYGHHCPEIGFVKLDRTEVQAVTADLLVLVASLGDLYDCKRRKLVPVCGNTWRVGAVNSYGGDIAIYFQSSLCDGSDIEAAEGALALEVAVPFRLILTAQGRAAVPGVHVVPLCEIVSLEAATGRFQALADLRSIVGAPIKRSGGAPNRYGTILTDLIQSRISSGNALAGLNAEAHAIKSVFRSTYPAEQVPSLPTIKRYLSTARAGS